MAENRTVQENLDKFSEEPLLPDSAENLALSQVGSFSEEIDLSTIRLGISEVPVPKSSVKPPRTSRLPGQGMWSDSVFKPHFGRVIKGIVSDYWSARTPITGHPKLSRGTARVVASITEERIAELLVDAFPQIDQILIDQELTVAGQPLRKPDLVVRVGTEIRLLVDIKMDFNWIRGKLPLLAKNANLWMQSAREAGNIGVSERAERSRDKRTLALSSDCEYVFIVVSGLGTTAYDMCLSLTHTPYAEARGKRSVHKLVLWPTVHANSSRYATALEAETDLVRYLSGVDLHALENICVRTLTGSRTPLRR